MPVKIWFATWNCENMAPTPEHMRYFLHELRSGVPDLVVVGLQEANKDKEGKFVAERMTALYPNYTLIASQAMPGMTKMKRNFQHIGVLVKRSVAGNVTDIATQVSDNKVKLKEYGKGGVIATMKLNIGGTGQEFAFISAHLDSKKEKSRTKQITTLLTKAAGIPMDSSPAAVQSAIRARFGAVFFMGDLNYRLNPSGRRGMTSPFMTFNSNTPGDDLATCIASDATRRILLPMDMLLDSPLVTQYNFEFPQPIGADGSIFLPSYKMDYRIKGSGNPCAQMARNPNAANIKKCYFGKGKIYNNSRKCYDFGWLDRVGFSRNGSCKVTIEDYYSDPSVVLSDHAPVVMKTTVQ